MLRTFIAIDLPIPLLDALAATQMQVREYLRAHGQERALRWSPTKNLHLTLRFLGDTTQAQCAEMTTRLRALAAQVAPFSLQVEPSGRSLGGFPNLRQPRVVWAGVAGEMASLRQLQAAVEREVQALGYAPEEKAYSPHLTLARAARNRDRRALRQVGEALGDYTRHATAADASPFVVDHLTFYQSELSAGGSRYTALAELPLMGA